MIQLNVASGMGSDKDPKDVEAMFARNSCTSASTGIECKSQHPCADCAQVSI